MDKATFFLYSLWVLMLNAVLSSKAFAISGPSVGGMATVVTGQFGALAKLITAGAYVSGMAFIVGAIVKFKAHKDQPTQIPIGTPIALLFIGSGLLFVPSVFRAMGLTLVGSGATYATISGITSF